MVDDDDENEKEKVEELNLSNQASNVVVGDEVQIIND